MLCLPENIASISTETQFQLYLADLGNSTSWGKNFRCYLDFVFMVPLGSFYSCGLTVYM